MQRKPRAFISYARLDGEAIARDIRKRLEEEAPDVALWQDRANLEGGVGWWKQIEEALEQVEILVLVMTPAALRSAVARKEWKFARQQGVRVYPVKGAADPDLAFDELPRWMRRAQFFDLDAEWETFKSYLRSPGRTSRVPFMAPDLGKGYVERTRVFEELKPLLVDPERGDSVVGTVLIHGPGGVGKSTLAIALCHDDDVVTAFDDGIFWVTLGERPNLLQGVTQLYSALTGERPGFVNEEDAAFHLAEKLEGKNSLIVIDDVWNAADLAPFLRGGGGCARLVTTRNADVTADASHVGVEEMTPAEAVAMLSQRLQSIPNDARLLAQLAERLQYWPLLLELAGASLAHRVKRGEPLEGAVAYLNKKLDKQGLTAFDAPRASRRHEALASTVEASLDLLDSSERAAFAKMVVFPEDADVPLSVVSDLLGLDEIDTEDFVQRLDTVSLLKFSVKNASIRFHDLMRTYLGSQVENLPELHRKLVETWGELDDSSGHYAWRWIGYHLVEAGQSETLRRRLLDFAWIRRKVQALDVMSLLADFERVEGDGLLAAVQGAIRLSVNQIEENKSQLASQLLARLHPDVTPEIDRFREQVRDWRGESWLRPLLANLTPPGGPLLFTLKGHGGRVRCVAITPDGTRAVSGADDCQIKVWDLERGTEIRTLLGHTGWIRALALIADTVFSAADDHTLRSWSLASGRCESSLDLGASWIRALAVTTDGGVAACAANRAVDIWDLRTGELLHRLGGHRASVTAVTIGPDDNIVFSASEDRSIRVWEIASGGEKAVLKGHRSPVSAIALSRAGSRLASASADDTIRLWEWPNREEEPARILTDESSGVNAIALAADEQRLVAGSDDRTLRVWSLRTGQEEARLEGHVDGVQAVALTADGSLAVSGSDDCTLKVWRLGKRGATGKPAGHSARIRSVAFTPDDRHIVSVADDRATKVWNKKSGELVRTYAEKRYWPLALAPDGETAVSVGPGGDPRRWSLADDRDLCLYRAHSDRVRALTITPDNRLLVSAADDRTIRVWDLVSGEVRCVISLERQWVRSLSVTPDGRYVISASDGNALKLWSLDDGRECATLRGHRARINAVGISGDGRYAFSGSDDHTSRMWSLDRKEECAPAGQHEASVTGVAVSADGMLALSCSLDGTLRVWSLPDGSERTRFTAEAPFRSCALSGDGRTVAAGDNSGAMHILELVD